MELTSRYLSKKFHLIICSFCLLLISNLSLAEEMKFKYTLLQGLNICFLENLAENV